jgi:crotonobetainyl-CoA:carnitine CoA-transferase CaiB-like acyl-CoA transferase
VVVLLGMESQRHLPAIATALGSPEWATDDRFSSRIQRFHNRRELTQLIADIMLSKTLPEWEAIFAEHDVWYDVSQRTATAVDDPQLHAAGCFVQVPQHPSEEAATTTVVASPFDFNGQQSEVGGPLGQLGEHTAEVLAAAGVSPRTVDQIVATAAAAAAKL